MLYIWIRNFRSYIWNSKVFSLFCLLFVGFFFIVFLVFNCDNGGSRRVDLLKGLKIMELWFLLFENFACVLRWVYFCYGGFLFILYVIDFILFYYLNYEELDVLFYIVLGVGIGIVSNIDIVIVLKGFIV